jgi:hypothetical protein
MASEYASLAQLSLADDAGPRGLIINSASECRDGLAPAG